MKTLSICCLLAAFPLAAAAGSTIEIGPIKLMVEEDGWQQTEVKTEDIGIDKGFYGTIRGKSKVLTLPGPDGSPMAVLLIYASWGTGLSLRFTSTCKGPEAFYVRDFTKGKNLAPECVVLGLPMRSVVYKASGWLPRMSKLDESEIEGIPREGYLLRGIFSSSNGSSISVEGILSVDFAGLPNGKPASDAGALPEGVAAWADAFGEAARKAVNSIGGKFQMPPLIVKPVAE